jgi:hypothetical protein
MLVFKTVVATPTTIGRLRAASLYAVPTCFSGARRRRAISRSPEFEAILRLNGAACSDRAVALSRKQTQSLQCAPCNAGCNGNKVQCQAA